MTQTLTQLKGNRGVWRWREGFRYRRWTYWHKTKNMAERAKWWNLYKEAHDKRVWYDKEIARRTPKPAPSGLTTFDGHPVASWIVPILQWARAHGWHGYVVSGYRTPTAQWAAAIHYAAQLGRSVWSVYPSGPLASNHCKYTYPGGAVDVTEYRQLYYVLKNYRGPRTLRWAGLTIGDYVHFSANGH